MKKIFGSSILVALIASAALAFGLTACSNGSDGNAALLAAGGTKYAVTISTEITNGTVTSDKASAAQGETVTLTASPASGYKLATLSVTDADGTVVSVMNGKFTMPAKNVTVTATFFALPPAYKKIDTVTIDGTQYDIVTFGSWPQTIKANNVEVSKQCESKTVGDFTYYKASDRQWYAEIKENAKTNYETYSDGTSVARSSVDSYKWFKVEPIKWRVLTTDYNGKGKKLLLAENILIGKRYDASKSYYQNSEIRKWLNSNANSAAASDHSGSGGFLKTAFTDEELATISDTSVDNSARSITPDANAAGWNSGNNQYAIDTPTTDKVFLLSEQEVTTSAYGFDVYNAYKGDGTHNESTRIRQATDYAKAGGVSPSKTEGEGGFWWLRSPANDGNDNGACVVGIRGEGVGYGLVSAVDNGVVPALCVGN